jgi:hypothetical protein
MVTGRTKSLRAPNIVEGQKERLQVLMVSLVNGSLKDFGYGRIKTVSELGRYLLKMGV